MTDASEGRPRIHWVSPLPPARTDIAEYTRRILPDLARHADIVLWTDGDSWDDTLERHARVRRFDPTADLPFGPDGPGGPGAGAEAVFLHVGNSWEFHAGIVALGARVPGILVLHDLAIVEMLRDLVANGLADDTRLRAEARRWYGPEGEAVFRRVLAGGPVRPAELARFPMWEAVLGRATAVLTHTPGAFETVAACRYLPAYRLELPFAITPRQPAERAQEGPLRLVQFGHIGPNRRLEQVFEALSRVRPRDDVPGVEFTFDIFGRLWDPAHLEGRARELGLADRIRFRGFAPEAELDRAIAEAHLVFNLRDPTMGEASGSQLRIWNASALAVVTDLGWYATLPDETVARIPPADEIGALERLIRRIDAERDLPARIGAAGRNRLEALHGAPRYAAGIARLARSAERDARDRMMADAARRILASAPAPRLMAPRLSAMLADPDRYRD